MAKRTWKIGDKVKWWKFKNLNQGTIIRKGRVMMGFGGKYLGSAVIKTTHGNETTQALKDLTKIKIFRKKK